MKSRDKLNLRVLNKKGVFNNKSGTPTIRAVIKAKDNYKFLIDHFTCKDPDRTIQEWRAKEVISEITNDNGERLYYLDKATNSFVTFEEKYGDREEYQKLQFSKLIKAAMRYSPSKLTSKLLIQALKAAKEKDLADPSPQSI